MVTVESPLILVTGSSGLLGTAVCRDLVSSYRVVGIDKKPGHDDVLGMNFKRCDLTSGESVRSVMGEIEEEYGRGLASVIHLAAYYDFTGEPSPLYESLTVQGTRRLLTQLQVFNVEQFVFSSTLLVFKPPEEGSFLTEDSELQGEWAYPQSKIKTEKLIQRERGDISTAILRIAGVYDE